MKKRLFIFIILLILFLSIFSISINSKQIKKSNKDFKLDIKELVKKYSTKSFDLNFEDIDYDMEGGYSFSPCSCINISGNIQYSYEKFDFDIKVLFWYLLDGNVKINDFDRNYKENEITALGIILLFNGTISDNPIEINGDALWACVFEFSSLVKIESEKLSYTEGSQVNINIINIGNNPITINNPSFFVLDNDTDEFINYYFENNVWTLKPGDKISWSWNQKDHQNDQVPVGNYSIIGQLSINSRIHAPGVGFKIIEDKSKFTNIFFEKFFRFFPIFQNLF